MSIEEMLEHYKVNVVRSKKDCKTKFAKSIDFLRRKKKKKAFSEKPIVFLEDVEQ